MRHRVGWVAFLAVLWVLLWGSVSAANVLSGVALGAVIVALFPPRATAAHTLRPVPAVQLAVVFLWEFVKANVVLAGLVLRGRRSLAPGIVAVPLQRSTDAIVTLVANAMTLTPGTLTLEVHRGEPTVLYLHCVRLDDPETVRRATQRFESLALRAFASRAVLDGTARAEGAT
jgi:multicomponent Na+:H+ antiporter subunit E